MKVGNRSATDIGNFHVLPWKIPLTFMEVNLTSNKFHGNLHGSTSASTDFHGNKLTFMELAWKFLYGSWWKLPWK